jgi:hypothetical protein
MLFSGGGGLVHFNIPGGSIKKVSVQFLLARCFPLVQVLTNFRRELKEKSVKNDSKEQQPREVVFQKGKINHGLSKQGPLRHHFFHRPP